MNDTNEKTGSTLQPQAASASIPNADTERLDWLERQAKASSTGVSFDYCRHTEDGIVTERGYRFMRRHFLGEREGDIRAAIDVSMGKDDEILDRLMTHAYAEGRKDEAEAALGMEARQGRDAQRLDGEATTARPEGERPTEGREEVVQRLMVAVSPYIFERYRSDAESALRLALQAQPPKD